MRKISRRYAGFAIAGLLAVGALGSAAGAEGSGVRFRAALAPVPHDPAADNGSNATGGAQLSRVAGRLTVNLRASGLTPALPHAMHIHGEVKARNECPPASADINNGVTSTAAGTPDGLVSFFEGDPFYGPVQVSFTVSGDTSAASALALDRFPVADAAGRVSYQRSLTISNQVAAKLGKLHIVVHGHDLDGDGAYSNLQEATLPVACGVIQQSP